MGARSLPCTGWLTWVGEQPLQAASPELPSLLCSVCAVHRAPAAGGDCCVLLNTWSCILHDGSLFPKVSWWASHAWSLTKHTSLPALCSWKGQAKLCYSRPMSWTEELTSKRQGLLARGKLQSSIPHLTSPVRTALCGLTA